MLFCCSCVTHATAIPVRPVARLFVRRRVFACFPVEKRVCGLTLLERGIHAYLSCLSQHARLFRVVYFSGFVVVLRNRTFGPLHATNIPVSPVDFHEVV